MTSIPSVTAQIDEKEIFIPDIIKKDLETLIS